MIDFNFSQTQNIFSQGNDSSRCCPGKHVQNDSVAQAIKRIASLSKAGDIKECISNINALMEFLNHENDNVKKCAVAALIQLVEKAAEFLAKETDPEKIVKYSESLLNAIDAIEGSSVPLDSETKGKLGEVKSFLNDVLKTVEKGEDPFRSVSKRSNTRNNTDIFTSSLEQTRRAVIGQNYSDEFIHSDLTHIRDMSISGSINRQFQTSQNPDGSSSRFIFA